MSMQREQMNNNDHQWKSKIINEQTWKAMKDSRTKSNAHHRDSIEINSNRVEAEYNHWNLMKINSSKDNQWTSVRIHANH